MKQSFELVILHVFKSEGGLSMDPNDRGNWTTGIIGKGELKGTKYGISAMTFPDYDIKNLELADAHSIYKAQYWDTAKCDDLPYGLDYSVFDFAVNSGVARAVRFLQKILGVKVDGIVGLKTLAAVKERDTIRLINQYNDARLDFMKTLKTWNRYGKGWARRVQHVRQVSRDLVDGVLDGHVARPEAAPVVPYVASGKKRISDIAAKPEMIAGSVSAVSGLLAAVSDAPVLQYGLAGAILIGAVTAGYWFYNRMQQEVMV